MATASRTMSPGGSLLRASRMFSLPQAIPSPPGDFQAATSYNSETATQAFPTLQTVTAPENFRQRGDWGFKRNFPMRSTAKTSTPYLRVKQVDSIEHVTDFASAADHTLSLEKWQEMNIAITLPHSIPDSSSPFSISSMDMRPESVFESKYDFTALDSEKKIQAGQMRWKYGGPWLATLTEGEFQKYIKKNVRPRKAEFRQFLREQLAPRLTSDAVRASVEGGDAEAMGVKEVQPGDITEDQLNDFLRELRQDRQSLFDLVGRFLDLAPIEPPKAASMLDNLAPGQTKILDRENPYALHGPPITHPSAGLSYLRTMAFLENHPAYGPLRYHPPVEGRVFVTSSDATFNGKNGTLGVGGFIVGQKNLSEYRSSSTRSYDPSAHGGQKVWAHVFSAQVNSQGRVLLHAEEARDKSATMSKLVEEEMRGKKQLFHKASEDSTKDFQRLREPRSAYRHHRTRYIDSRFTKGSRESYGMGQEQSKDQVQ